MYSTQVYPEDMRFIKSQLMWVAVFGFRPCGCICVSVCARTQMQGRIMLISLSYTNKKVDMHGVICGRRGLGEG